MPILGTLKQQHLDMVDVHTLSSWSSKQQRLSGLIVARDDIEWTVSPGDHQATTPLRWVAGVDISFFGDIKSTCDDAGEGSSARSPGERAVAALVVLSFPDLAVVYEDYEEVVLDIPYVPGFLGFRECPVFQHLLKRVAATKFNPQVVFVDGFGVLHPNGCGSASQLGVLTGYPTIGVAKNILAVDGLGKDIRQKSSRGDSGATGGQETSAPDCTPDAYTQGSAATQGIPGGNKIGSSAGGEGQGPPGWGGIARKALGEANGSEIAGSDVAGEGGGVVMGACGGEVCIGVDGSEAAGTSKEGSRSGGTKAGVPGKGVTVTPLVGNSGAVLGASLCSASSKKPIYVSIGHRVGLDTAVEVVWKCCKHRIPEPIRQADLRSRQYVRRHQQKPLASNVITVAST